MARFIGAIGVLTIAVLASGCARDERPAPRSAQVERRAPPRAAPAVPVSAANYVASAGSIDLFIIGSSELALQRSSNQRVRDFARMMIDAHKGTSGQLSFAGRRLNLLPSATPNPTHRAMLNELQQAANFDATYVRQQRAIHREASVLHSAYAAAGTSPTLRPVAKALAPIIERHIRMLNYL